jgi:Protein of unknown function (DUF2971)
MPSPVPKAFYRYRSFSTATLDSLCRDTLHYANPTSFNDPLDCKPTLESDSNRQVLRKLLVHLIKRRVAAETLESLKRANVQGERAASHAQRRAQTEATRELDQIAYHATNPEYTVSEEEAEVSLLTQEIYRELLGHYERGVCCFSTTYSSPLLWSHYGDQHKGVSIGYHLDRTPRPALRKVIYGGNRTIRTSTLASALLEGNEQSQDELDRDVLLRKARGWSYEREWRLLGRQGIQDSCLGLKDVTFGLRCSASVKHAVVQALEGRRQSVRFYEIYEVRGTFGLRRAPLDLDELGAYLPRTAESAEEMFGPEDSE